MKSEIETLEKKFFSDGYRLAANATETGFSQESLFSAVKQMHRVIDELVDSVLIFAREQEQQTDCKKGCAWCCRQPVFALSYELEYLSTWIKNKFSIDKQEIIAFRARQKRENLRGKAENEIMVSKHACPLLEEGICIVYDARPVACRIYLSTNVKSCLHFYKNPDDDTKYPALLSFPMRLGRMMNQGFKTAMKTHGIKTEELRIEQAL